MGTLSNVKRIEAKFQLTAGVESEPPASEFAGEYQRR
jgi:hypothetical protein